MPARRVIGVIADIFHVLIEQPSLVGNPVPVPALFLSGVECEPRLEAVL
jgi:hypothetical protein